MFKSSLVKTLSILLMGILGSCASNHHFMRGTVAMKINKTEANICLGKNHVNKGDTILFFKNKCTGGGGGSDGGSEVDCEMIKLGEATVTALLNDHYSTVKLKNEFFFEEGTLVQKQNKK